MKTKNNLIKSALLFAFGIFLISCTKEDSISSGVVDISARATFVNTAGKSGLSNKSNAQVEITKFLLNIKEFEFQVDSEEQENENDQWDDDGFYNFDDDIELQGPFELDLMEGRIPFLSIDMPNSVFEEIEFKFDKSTNLDSELFNKSIIIEGTVNGIPFKFWNNIEEEIEIDFENEENDIVVQGTGNDIVIDFNIAALFNDVNGIDLSQATDGNGDGVIEINPNDNDGNSQLASEIINELENLVEMEDDDSNTSTSTTR